MTINNYNFVREIILKTMSISLDDKGIVHVKYLKGQTIEIEDKNEELKANLEITKGIKHPFVFSFENYVTVTKEAKEHSIKIEQEQPYLCVAIVVQNLAYQLMADFYFKFYKPQVPYKVFKTKEKAIDWLLEHRNNYGNGSKEGKKNFLFF